MDLPYQRLVEHHERKACPCEQAASPAVVGAVDALVNLIEIVSSAPAPLIVVVLVDVVAPGKLIGVSLSLGWRLSSIRALDVGPVVDIIVIDSQ